jgi:hypothetical protein
MGGVALPSSNGGEDVIRQPISLWMTMILMQPYFNSGY